MSKSANDRWEKRWITVRLGLAEEGVRLPSGLGPSHLQGSSMALACTSAFGVKWPMGAKRVSALGTGDLEGLCTGKSECTSSGLDPPIVQDYFGGRRTPQEIGES